MAYLQLICKIQNMVMSRKLLSEKSTLLTNQESSKGLPTPPTAQSMEEYKVFNDRYSTLIKQFQREIPEADLAAVAQQSIAVIEAWEKMSHDIQQVLQRQTILHGLTQYMFAEELPVATRLKVLRACLAIMVKINIASIVEKADLIDNVVSPKQTVTNSRLVLEGLMKVSQDSKNDKSVAESGVLKYAFQLLAGLVTIVQSKNAKKDRRALFERKGSLKKIEDTPKEILTIERPRSKGKPALGSLNKRDYRTLLTQATQKIEPADDLAFLLLNFIKNCSANPDLRRKILQEQCLALLNKYILIWDEKNITSIGTKMLIQITAAHRHLAAQQKSVKAFLKSDTVECWTRLIELFPRSNDIVLNLLRLFSKVSMNEECCEKIHNKKVCTRNLVSFFREYKTNIYIIIRIAFIFANMTSFLMDIRNELYFEFNAFVDVYACFEHYCQSELHGKSDIDKMGISVAAWDYQVMKKESDVDALVKIIRLLANLFTVNEIGQDIYMNKGLHFKGMIKRLKDLLEKKCSIVQHADLIICSLSCMANALYYDRQVLMSNLEYKTTKTQLVALLGNFIVQAQNEEICCEGLRVLSNLSRMKEFVKGIVDAKLHEATLILLQSSSKEIVYYSLGVLINLLADTDFKAKYKLDIVYAVLDILRECSSDDFDIVTIGLRCLGGVVEGGTENLDGKLLKDIEDALQKIGGQCDLLMVRTVITQQPNSNSGNSSITNLQESRNLINLILNNLPEDSFTCPVKNCGRKFPDQKKLKQHVDRRHKLS